LPLVTRATAPLTWVPYPTHKAFQGFFFLVFERSSPTQKSSSFKLKDSFKKIILQLKDPFKKFIHQLKDPFKNASIEGPVQKIHPSIEGPLQKIHP
jgi:hypothetical protein